MVPFDWKLANVVPVYKKGDQEFVENYRPISLLSLISKVLERCVFNYIKDHIYSQLNPCQHGFVPGKNCVSQLIEVSDKIGRQLDRGKQIDVIYLDMSKAFDKVSHKRLLLVSVNMVLEVIFITGFSRTCKIVVNKQPSWAHHHHLVK